MRVRMHSGEYYTEKGIKATREKAKKEGVAIGSVIVHPSRGLCFSLREVKGDIAVGYIPAENSPTGQEIVEEFPLDEVFDPNVANEMFMELVIRDVVLNLLEAFRNSGKEGKAGRRMYVRRILGWKASI